MIGSPVFRGHPDGTSGQKRNSSSSWLAICGDVEEWNLLGRDNQHSFDEIVEALHGRLEPQTQALAAQDFRHTSQGDQETVADFIRRLERTDKIECHLKQDKPYSMANYRRGCDTTL